MKRFNEVSLGRRHAELYRARSDRTPTRRGLLFAVVADKLDLIFGRKDEKKKNAVFTVSYLIKQCT